MAIHPRPKRGRGILAKLDEDKIGVKTEMDLDTIKSFYCSLGKPLDNFQDNELNVIGEVIDDLGQIWMKLLTTLLETCLLKQLVKMNF